MAGSASELKGLIAVFVFSPGDKLVSATELVKLLSLEKSVRGAIKLVTALKLPNLAERFNSILEEKLDTEKVGNSALVPLLNNSDSVFVVRSIMFCSIGFFTYVNYWGLLAN